MQFFNGLSHFAVLYLFPNILLSLYLYSALFGPNCFYYLLQFGSRLLDPRVGSFRSVWVLVIDA